MIRITKVFSLALFGALLGSVLTIQPAEAMENFQTYFNNPYGTASEKQAIRTPIVADIDAAQAGDVVRIATYTLNDPYIVTRLIEARNRGVQVQVVLDMHDAKNSQALRLRAALGTLADSTDGSWVKVCGGSCRTYGPGVLHSKIYMFSRDGSMYIGTANLAERAMWGQWNEMVRFTDAGIYTELNALFDEMKMDAPAPLRAPVESGNFLLTTYPRFVSQADDPILLDMHKIQCQGATGTAGQDGRTVVLVSQYALNGKRGVYLATKLASLKRQGCVVRVALGGRSSKPPKAVLRNAGILQASKGGIGGGTTSRHAYNHEKWMAVSGVFDGNTDSNMLWTGSLNWSENEFRRDNVTLRVRADRAVFDQHLARINQLKR